MKLHSSLIEGIVLTVFFSLFLYLALGMQWDQKIMHDFPYGYGASDAFFHQSVAEYMKEEGKIRYTPPYEVGGYNHVYDAHPPMLFELSSVVSLFSGVEVYDVILLVTSIFWAFCGILVYLIIRRFNVMVALLSLPIMILTLTGNYRIALPWGYWLFITGVFFMLAVFWAIGRIELAKSWILFGILLGAIGLSHIPEAFFLVVFLGMYFAYQCVVQKKLDKNLLKTIIFAGIISFIISAFTVNIFLGSFGQTEGYRNKYDTELGNASVYLKDLGWASIPIVLGVLFFLFIKKKDLAGWFALYMFLVSYLTIIGLGKRAATHRWFWYFYLAFFFGLALYQLIKLVYKDLRPAHAAILSIVVLVVLANPLFGNNSGPGVMDPYTWKALQWIGDNLPSEARVYYFYSDTLTHNAALYDSERLAFNVARADYFDAIQNKEIRRHYNFGLADSYAAFLCDAIPLQYKYYIENPKLPGIAGSCNGTDFTHIPTVEYSQDICDVEYYYFNKVASQPVLGQYNMILRQLLLENNHTEQIYENELVTILKNNKPGEDCLQNDTIKLG